LDVVVTLGRVAATSARRSARSAQAAGALAPLRVTVWTLVVVVDRFSAVGVPSAVAPEYSWTVTPVIPEVFVT
jgi:hypothetical protein